VTLGLLRIYAEFQTITIDNRQHRKGCRNDAVIISGFIRFKPYQFLTVQQKNMP